MAIAIGISSCASSVCHDADEVMGTILHNGKFNPQYHEPSQPPYQNFSVKIPATFTPGTAQINVAHATLIGVSPKKQMPFIICSNIITGWTIPLPRGSEPYGYHCLMTIYLEDHL